MLNKLTEFWYLLVAAITALGGAVKWWYGHKEEIRKADAARLQTEIEKLSLEAESSEALYEALELLKKKVIASVLKEVSMTNTIAEKDVLIEGLKLHCPECYITFMIKFNSDANEPKGS